MTSEQVAVLLIPCGVLLAVQLLAFCSLCHICAALKRENRFYRQFLEQQYRMETDCLDACREMVRESVRTEASAREPREPRFHRIPLRGTKSTF